jgi:hypothetical protein
MDSNRTFRKKNHRRIRLARLRSGTSLLEVMAATVLGSMLLIPMVTILVDCSKWSNRMEYQSELLSLAESCSDETKFKLATNFAAGRMVGNFASQGFPQVRYNVRNTVPLESALRGKYLDIQLTVWADLNSNGTHDSGLEPKQDLSTGLSKP